MIGGFFSTSLAALAIMTLTSSGSAQAPDPTPPGGVKGEFSLIEMVHTNNSQFGMLEGVNPWDGVPRKNTQYVYRSIPCTGNAPVNNISSDLPSYGTRVAGSRVPSSTRAHPFSFRLVRKHGEWLMRGAIRFTVCKLGPGPTPQGDPVPDAQKSQFLARFTAPFKRMTGESLNWQGRFRLTGGTGRYEDLTGSGTIAGYLFCFAPEGCVQTGGQYLDGQFTMQGTYADPTPELETAG